ncbi:MAG: ECF-type sigma factor [Bryobacteraceae bacterium]
MTAASNEGAAKTVSHLNQSQLLISRLLSDAGNGTLHGPEQLVTAFYPELKRMAAAKMRSQRAGHTWRPTELVSELYLELVKIEALRPVKSNDQREKSAFFSLAAQAMHWLLVRHTRRLSWKVHREEIPASLPDSSPGAHQLTELDELLGDLAAIDPQLRLVVELRVFEGLSIEECTGRLGCSISTVTRNWRFAKRWLQSRLGPGDAPSEVANAQVAEDG